MEYTPIPQSDIEEMKSFPQSFSSEDEKRQHEFLSQVLVFADENQGIELVRRIDGQFTTVCIDADRTYTSLADLIHEAEQNLR